MKSFRISTIFLAYLLALHPFLLAKEKVYVADNKKVVNINFKDLEIKDFITLVSKVMNKNVLMNYDIRGKVEFISNTPVYKDNVLEVLQSVLDAKGYTLVDSGDFYEVVRAAEASQYNLPFDKRLDDSTKQMVTEAVRLNGENVDIVASKIRHIISKSAKLITVKENNTILLTDYPKNIATARKAIQVIEEDTEKDVLFYPLENIKAQTVFNDVNKIIKEIFNQRIETQKVNLFPNKDANSLVVIAAPALIPRIKSVIQQFDTQSDEEETVVKIHSLKNSEAKNMLNVLNAIVAKKQYSDAKDRPSLSADIEGNNIVILGKRELADEVLSIVQELDKEQLQVYVKAQIIEISTNRASQLGIKYGMEGGQANTEGLFTFSTSTGGTAIPLSSTVLGYLDMDTIESGMALGATIDFLKTNGAADVVSEPSILCINNKESSIYVGQTQSFLTSSVAEASEDAEAKNTYKRVDIGLTLAVKPRIAIDGKVSLDVQTTIEDALADRPGAGGNPTTTKREVKTLAIVRNGESVIIGGLIKNNQTESVSKLPLLGDIPVMGHLFRSTTTAVDKINLVIVLTPYIVDKSSNLSDLREKLFELDRLQRDYNERVKKELEEKRREKTDEGTEDSDYQQEQIDKITGL